MKTTEQIYELCPVCSSTNEAKTVFGFVGEIVIVQAEPGNEDNAHGEYEAPRSSPKYLCNTCKTEWSQFEWETILSGYQKSEFERVNTAEQAAIKRGTFEVIPNKFGYVKCPHCDIRFSIKTEDSWDGSRHKDCLTKLTIKSV